MAHPPLQSFLLFYLKNSLFPLAVVSVAQAALELLGFSRLGLTKSWITGPHHHDGGLFYICF